MKDFYRTLNILPDATHAQVRKAFRGMAMAVHPDISGSDPTAADSFIEVREAYETLINEEKRQKYDEALKNYRKETTQKKVVVKSHSPAHVYSPRFSQERMLRKYKAVLLRAKPPLLSKNDIQGALEVSLEDSVRDGSYTISLANDLSAPDRISKYQVTIPAGLHEKAWLKVEGLGYKNSVTEVGNLYIEIVFSKSSIFRVCGESLFYDLVIPPWQAAMGTQAQIPTLDGIETLSIPPILTSPQVKRIPEKGMYLPSGKRGHVWVNIRVEIPPPTSFRARRLWAELAEEYKRSQTPQ